MLQNTENKVIDNFFTDKEIDDIFYYVDNTKECSPEVHPGIGYSWHPCGVPDQIHNKVEKFVRENLIADATLTEICVARYRQSEISPTLSPHMDNFPSGRITIDVQLRSNTDWALVVEGKRFVLKDNQALVFAGTHQPHWREPKVFNDGEFVDMLFCHLTVPGVDALDKTEFKNMENFWIEKYKEQNNGK